MVENVRWELFFCFRAAVRLCGFAGRQAGVLSHQLFRVLLDFPPSRSNFVHVIFVSQKCLLRDPDGFKCGSMGVRVHGSQERMRFGSL